MELRFVYQTTNKLNGRKYIGKHVCTDLNDGYYGSNPELREDIKTFGYENFDRIILDYAETDEELAAKESYYLRLYQVVESPNFYNQSYSSSGGNTFKNWSKERYSEFIELQRKVQTGKSRSQKTKNRISKNNVGFKGKSHSEESRKRISESLKGNKFSDETRKKLAESSSKGKVYCYFNGELKFVFNNSSDGVRKFRELGLIKSDKPFGNAIKNNGAVSKGRLLGWEIVRLDKKTS